MKPEDVLLWLQACGYDSLDEFRHDYGLPLGGALSDLDLRAMAIRRCGVKKGASRGSVSKLHTNRPTVYVRDRLQNAELRDKFDVMLLEGLNLWSKVADISFSLTNDQSNAQIEVQVERIDGPSNTLAYAYFPMGSKYRLPLVFDSAEAWNSPSGPNFQTTACHEGGHNCGLDHDPTAQGIMAAFYNARIQAPTSDWEIQQIVSRYGPPIAAPPVIPPSVPTPTTPKTRLVITGTDLKIAEFK